MNLQLKSDVILNFHPHVYDKCLVFYSVNCLEGRTKFFAATTIKGSDNKKNQENPDHVYLSLFLRASNQNPDQQCAILDPSFLP